MGQACAVDYDDVMPLRARGAVRRGVPPPSQASTGSGGGRDVVHCPVKARQDLNSQDLFDAVMAGDVRRVKWSLQAQADPNAKLHQVGLQPLHVCTAQGHLQAAQALIEYEADVASSDNLPGLTPLSLACLSGHRELVRLFVCASAPLDAAEGSGGTPLLHAASRNLAEICEVLISSGSDVNAAFRTSADYSAVREELDNRNTDGDWRRIVYGTGRRLVEPLHVEGTTPLHIAAYHGSTRVCQYLLDAGARHGAIDVLMRSAVMLAGERGHVEVTSLLLERKCAIGANIQGHSVATLAAVAGHCAIVRLLLDFDVVDANFVTWAGGPMMLHVAAQHGRGGCVALLCEQDADVNAPLEPDGVSALMLAAARGFTDICQEMMAYGADVNEVDSSGRTAFAHAAIAGQAVVCQQLACHGASEQVVGRERSHVVKVGAPAAGGRAVGRRRMPLGAEDHRPPVSSFLIGGAGAEPAHAAAYGRAYAAMGDVRGPGGLGQPPGLALSGFARGGDRAAGLGL